MFYAVGPKDVMACEVVSLVGLGIGMGYLSLPVVRVALGLTMGYSQAGGWLLSCNAVAGN